MFCVVLLLGASGPAEAGKVKDIVKRSKIKSSVFLPSSRQVQTQVIRNSVFFSPLETAITDGPEHNSAIQTTKVDFTFDGWQVLPFEKIKRFDVWLIGYDNGWKETGSKISYNLPPGKKTYTLLARAKNKAGEFDNTAAARTFMVDVSEHWGKIKIISVVHRGTTAKPHYEKLTLRNQASDLGLNITGWKIKTKRFSFSFEIPLAARVYNPREPLASDPIVLTKSASVDIYVGKRSPLSVNFQENDCLGYLRRQFEGYDAVSGGSCPRPDPSSYNHLGLYCREFVPRIGNCETPQLSPTQFGGSQYNEKGEPACRDFILRSFNYQACVDRAKNRASFYLAKWKVYLGRTEEIFDDLDDAVYLYDGQGLLVDTYKYQR